MVSFSYDRALGSPLLSLSLCYFLFLFIRCFYPNVFLSAALVGGLLPGELRVVL